MLFAADGSAEEDDGGCPPEESEGVGSMAPPGGSSRGMLKISSSSGMSAKKSSSRKFEESLELPNERKPESCAGSLSDKLAAPVPEFAEFGAAPEEFGAAPVAPEPCCCLMAWMNFCTFFLWPQRAGLLVLRLTQLEKEDLGTSIRSAAAASERE